MTWQWDAPTIIGLSALFLTAIGYGTRLCFMVKKSMQDSIIHRTAMTKRVDAIENLQREMIATIRELRRKGE